MGFRTRCPGRSNLRLEWSGYLTGIGLQPPPGEARPRVQTGGCKGASRPGSFRYKTTIFTHSLIGFFALRTRAGGPADPSIRAHLFRLDFLNKQTHPIDDA